MLKIVAGVPKKTENKNLVELFDNNFLIIYQTVCIQPQRMSRNLREGHCERLEINSMVRYRWQWAWIQETGKMIYAIT